jgi:hypothetical protein
MNSIKIQALVRDMDESMRKYKSLKESNFELYKQSITDENKTLYEEFPTIFEMHIEGKLDETFFEMLKLRRKVEKGELTDDEASKLIGQKLFDRYVAPIIGSDTPQSQTKPLSYTEFYNQFNNTDAVHQESKDTL